MTDLNMGLWGAGGIVILGVMAYNFWQEYKAKKNVELAFGAHQDDVLMKSRDPTLAGSSLDSPRDSSSDSANSNSTPSTFTSFDSVTSNSTSFGASNSTVRQEPTLNTIGNTDAANAHIANSHQSALLSAEHAEDKPIKATLAEVDQLPVDDFIDCVIPLELETPTRGDKLVSEIQSFGRVGNKPVHFIGTNLKGKREIINHAGTYTHLLAGVQLATRSGALNELEYSESVTKLRQIADNLNAHPDIPDMKHVIDAGRDLHLFVSEHDAQLSVNIKTKGAPWGKSALMAALEKQGFDTWPDGRLAMPDGEGGALFTLSTNGGDSGQVTSSITLLLDVPCVAPSRDGYSAMVSCAKSLALRLGGDLVDDGNEVLDETTLDQIQEQVELFYTAMQAADIPAGSSRAIRLFS